MVRVIPRLGTHQLFLWVTSKLNSYWYQITLTTFPHLNCKSLLLNTKSSRSKYQWMSLRGFEVDGLMISGSNL